MRLSYITEKEKEFYRSKSNEYKGYTLALLIVISIACVLLNGWDRVVDPAHGAAVLWIRLLMAPAFVFYLIPYLMKKDYPALSISSFLSIVHLVTIYMIIVSQFDNGTAHSLEGYIVAFICFLAITTFSPYKYVLVYSILLFFYPVICDLLFFHDVVNMPLYFITMPVIVGLCILIAYTEEMSAYQKFLLSEKVKEQANIDSLTKCFNRRKFDEMFGETPQRAEHEGALSVVLVDIDNFKRVNDLYGHRVGDQVLRDIVIRIKSVVRTEDVVIRWGGEEFLVIFPHAGIEECRKLAERIIEICDLPLGDTDRVTVSAGYAQLCEEDVEGLVSRADGALYEAKRNGKRQARMAEQVRS